MKTVLTSLLLSLAVFPARAQAPAVPPSGAEGLPVSSGRCGVCHPAERVLFEKSQHAQEEVRCVSCHGGDDRSLDARVAHGGKVRIARKDIPAMCASCHASEERMRPYNLPVDQYALYQISGHGRRLAKGDLRVAVCSDCHGAHDILPPKDPASSLYVLNIPRTCGRCHGDPALLKERGLPDNFHKYERSVHARALEQKGNLRAPTCVSCHGVHGAAPPNVGDVDKVCGQCHTAERRYYAAGTHAIARGGRRPECVDCHDAHGVQSAQPERFATSCALCHEGNRQRIQLGQTIWTDYRTAAAEVDKAAALVVKADAVPIHTDDYRARIEEARTYLREALPAAHAVQTEVVAGFTTRARALGQEVQREIETKLANLRTHKFLLILFWFYVLLTLYVLKRFRDQAAR